MDINMPNQNGEETLKIMRSDPSLKHMPVVAFTGVALAEDVARWRSSGFADVVVKPVALKHLLALVEKLLSQRVLNHG
jgi:CheY-like chemotaxis protein